MPRWRWRERGSKSAFTMRSSALQCCLVKRRRLRNLLRILGPGFITGAADDDPSGIATYAQTGAAFGSTQLWFALFATPFMIAIQEMCGRIGLVTGKGLSGLIRRHYSRPLLFVAILLLLVANIFNIGADLGAMAAAAELVSPISRWVWLFAFTLFVIGLEIFVSYRTYAKFLKIFAIALLAYVFAAFSVDQPWGEIFHDLFIPSFSFGKAELVNIVALLGTTISPYLFFWQTDEEVEEEVVHHLLPSMGRGKPRLSKKLLGTMRTDTAVGMVFSNLIMFFIIPPPASTLGAHNIRTVATAAEAAAMLQPLAGPFAAGLFSLGVIGTGLLAVPILAGSASYAFVEAFGWHEGLSRTFRQAPAFYIIIALSTGIGFLLNFLHLPSFELLYAAAILNGVTAPPLLILILLIGSNRSIMGRRVNSRLSNILGWSLAIIMSLAAAVLLLTMVF